MIITQLALKASFVSLLRNSVYVRADNILVLFLSLILIGSGRTPLYAQLTSGSLTGTVYDSSGASVVSCTIIATSTETGAVRTVQTNSLGYYNIASLPPHLYKLTATATGFQTETSQVTVSLGQIANFDFHLAVGNTNQNIFVDASTVNLQLEKDSHELGNQLSGQTIENLPANGRNVFQALTAATNVSPYQGTVDNISYFNLGANSLTIGGSTFGTTTYLQDGVSNFNMLAKTANLQPSIESVQEVSLIQNGASARFDEPSVVNVITKDGSNRFHGRAYDYLKNASLDAIGYFAVPKPPLHYNQFGGNVGGPIVRNKLFFFFDYSGLRYSLGQTVFANVPTDAEKQGDFSQDPFTIYDPSTYNPQTGAISGFAQNKIPKTSISNFAKLYLQYYPSPTGSAIANTNYQKTAKTVTSYDAYQGRIDYTISARDNIYGAYATTNPVSISPNFTNSSIFNNASIQSATNAYVQESHTFVNNLLNISRFGYNHSNISIGPEGAGSQNFLLPYKIQNLDPDPSQWMPPVVAFSTHTGTGNPNNPNGAVQDLYEFADELNWTVGRHNMYVGGELDKINLSRFSADWPNGSFSFTGQYTSSHAASNLTGSDIADLLLGYPTAATGGTGVSTGKFHQWNVQPYFQDDWKINKILVVNLGMRYDYYSSPASDHSSVYDVLTNTTHNGTYHQNYLNLAPRIGFAYSIDSATVIHGGYGIYYTPFEYQELTFLLVHTPNFILQSNTYGLNQPTPVTSTFLANPIGSSQAPFTTALEMPTPYVQQWNLALQRSLGSNWIATLAYLGNKLTHQQLRHNPNQADVPSGPSDLSSINARRPYSYIGDVYEAADIGYANYNGLEVDLERGFTNGLSVLTNYVWSKALDISSAGNNVPEDGRNISRDYGLADFNSAQVFKLSSVYELPVGDGKRFLGGRNWFDKAIIGGWKVSEILTVQSGLPFSVSATDLSSTGAYHAQRANQICNGNHPANQSINKWFNTACYVQPAAGQLGNERKNNIIGPRTANIDVSFFKDFPFMNEKSVQFRSDFFDVFNHPLLGLPSASVSAPTYGQITSIGGARIIQLSLKLSF
jgi:hypothetical protein